MGRKKKPPDTARTSFVQIRVTEPFKGWLERYAAKRGETLSGLILELVIRAAKRDRFEPPPDQE